MSGRLKRRPFALAVAAALLCAADYPPPPELLESYIHDDEFDPGDFGWAKGRFADASDAEKAAYAAIPRWIARCMDDGRTKLQQQLAAAGYPVQALATLEVAQGQLSEIAEFLSSLPGVIEAFATTGTGDVVCRLAAASNADLQDLLLRLNESEAIRRSTSVVILSTVVPARVLPLLESGTSG